MRATRGHVLLGLLVLVGLTAAVVLGIWMVASSDFSGLPPWLALG
ncbi:hypothetical protein [Myxococcus xanthus]|nr:hypothetical protein [Myxococcus xanthus]